MEGRDEEILETVHLWHPIYINVRLYPGYIFGTIGGHTDEENITQKRTTQMKRTTQTEEDITQMKRTTQKITQKRTSHKWRGLHRRGHPKDKEDYTEEDCCLGHHTDEEDITKKRIAQKKRSHRRGHPSNGPEVSCRTLSQYYKKGFRKSLAII